MRILLNILFIFVFTAGFSQDIEGTSNPVHVSFATKESNAPDIFLVYKNAGALNTDGLVEFNLRILDESGIAEVRVNDEVVPFNNGDTVVLAYAYVPGTELDVYAKDRFNNAKEKSFAVKKPLSVGAITPSSAEGRFHALIIGVNDYQDPNITSLTEAVSDATKLKEILTSHYSFEEKNIIFLKNPTYEKLVLTFDDLSRDIGPGDLLLIFYAGHGYYNERTNIGYWLPADAQQSNTARWFRNSALVENIGAINSKHTLLISDACFSGAIFKTRAPFNNADPNIANLLRRSSRKAMTSGSLTTVPDESVFMKYLLVELSENNNKYLTSEDLFDEVLVDMRNNTNTRPLFGEIQNVGDEGGNFVFIKKD
jgi:hypothetical protein